jgi:protein-S-isoprenylcysteine O-methyltransferase Ste14
MNNINIRLISVLLLPAVLAITNYPPNAGSEIKKGDNVAKNGSVKHLFLQFVVMMFLVSILSYIHLSKYNTDLSNLEYYTLGVVLVGFAIRMWSYYELGSSFTFMLKTGKDQQLIKSGPYKVLVHPSYTGQVLVLVGALFFLTKSWVLSLGLLSASYYVSSKRIKVEEKLMRDKFGKEYDVYLNERYRFIPFVY